MYSEQARKLIEQVRSNRCNRKGCLSQQRDALDVVWFGQQYGECKEITCSACYICSDEAVKASVPTHHNVLPLTLFLEKFAGELKAYQQNRSSKEFFPKVMRQRSKELLLDLQRLETEVSEKLALLSQALVGFCKKIEEANLRIFKQGVLEEIIQMNSEGKLEGLLEKVMLLVGLLNVGTNSDAYHFEDLEQREKKLGRLSQQISDISQRCLEVLKDLHQSVREKNQLIANL